MKQILPFVNLNHSLIQNVSDSKNTQNEFLRSPSKSSKKDLINENKEIKIRSKSEVLEENIIEDEEVNNAVFDLRNMNFERRISTISYRRVSIFEKFL
jgi:hypothetical protein